jgi:hypothetical protein
MAALLNAALGGITADADTAASADEDTLAIADDVDTAAADDVPVDNRVVAPIDVTGNVAAVADDDATEAKDVVCCSCLRRTGRPRVFRLVPSAAARLFAGAAVASSSVCP